MTVDLTFLLTTALLMYQAQSSTAVPWLPSKPTFFLSLAEPTSAVGLQSKVSTLENRKALAPANPRPSERANGELARCWRTSIRAEVEAVG